MKATQQAYDLIKKYEGFSAVAYRCPKGKLTIGYGHTGEVRATDTITREAAENVLKQDVLKAETLINSRCDTGTLNQNQYDALVVFAYNIGGKQFLNSTLYRKLQANPNDRSIADEFKKWIYTTKVGKDGKRIATPLEGLRRRREAEAALYFKQ